VWAEQLRLLARSLGLQSHIYLKTGIPGYEGRRYWRVHISGDLSVVPTRVKRKQFPDSSSASRHPNRVGFTIEPIGEGDFCGWELDSDGLFLLGDFTVTHNSSFLVSVCDENIADGKTCMIVSAEDAEAVYADRLMARRSRVRAQALRDRGLNDKEVALVLETASKGEKRPMFVAANGEEEEAEGRRRGGWPLEDLLPHLAKLVREAKVDFIAFDYLQEFTTKQRYQDERLKFKAMAGLMRRFIRQLKICGIVFSQLTLSSETKIPTRHNIRECRDVANGSDVILIGFEPDSDVKDREGKILVDAGKKCIHVDKVKNGPRGAKVQMDWDSTSACFNRVRDPELVRLERMAAENNDLGSFADDVRYP
jgi:hypothetical protein